VILQSHVQYGPLLGQEGRSVLSQFTKFPIQFFDESGEFGRKRRLNLQINGIQSEDVCGKTLPNKTKNFTK
jgi:hypothetical protein